MIEIFWTPKTDVEELNRLNILSYEPESLLTYIKNNKSDTSENSYNECYATINYCKNIYFIRSPVDITLKYDEDKKFLYVDNTGFCDQLINNYVHNRINQTLFGKTLVSIFPQYVFYSFDDVLMESLPLLLIPHVKNTMHIPGVFNIKKWIRPIDWTFELMDNEVNVKRGDPLYAVKFVTPNNDSVKLTRVEYTEKLHKTLHSCVDVKRSVRNLPLDKLYNIAENYLQNVFRKK